MTEIDGSHGEGGGQLVRMAVAVAAALGVPVRIVNIRARRRVPGLAAQHVAAVRAVAALCDADCEGVQLRSSALSFAPRRLHGGEFDIEVGTAGSIALVLQAMLPAAVASGARVEARIRGGTDVPAAPPIDYVRLVMLPLLAGMGIDAQLELVRRGYYPKGGGEVRLSLAPVPRVRPLVCSGVGPLERIELLAHVAHLPRQIADRMARAARAELPGGLPLQSRLEVCPDERASGPGGAIVLRAVAANTVLGAGQVAERGVPAERLGQLAGRALADDVRSAACVDIHAADQVPVFLALAEGTSTFRARRLSPHAATVMWLLEQLSAARCTWSAREDGLLVQVTPYPKRLRPTAVPGLHGPPARGPG